MGEDITIIKEGTKSEEKGLNICLKEENVRDNAKNARDVFSTLQSELDEIEDDLKDGLSYLDMKNDILLSYMIDLCNIVLKKVRGEAISGHPSVERSVYYRVILEKIKAIDQRLAYQLNKVITMPDDAENQVQGVNVKNLDIDLGSDEEGEAIDGGNQSPDVTDEDDDDDDDDDEDGEEEGLSEDDDDHGSTNSETVDGNVASDESDIEDDVGHGKDLKRKQKAGAKKLKADSIKSVGLYKPPKLRSVAYDDGSESNSRRRRDHSDFYQDDDDNRDIVEESRIRLDEDRLRYEEENYTRLPQTNPKKTKRKMRDKKKATKGNKKFKGASKRR